MKIQKRVANKYLFKTLSMRVADQYLKQAGILDKLKDMFFTNKETGNKVKFNSLPKDQRDAVKKKYEEDKEKDSKSWKGDSFSKILSDVLYGNRNYGTYRKEENVKYEDLSEVSGSHLADAVFYAHIRSDNRMEKMQDYLTRTLDSMKEKNKKNLSEDDYRILGFELLKMDEFVKWEIEHQEEKWAPTVKELTKRDKEKGEKLQAHLDSVIADMKSVVSEKYRKEKYDEKTLKAYEKQLEEEKVRQKKMEDDTKEWEKKQKYIEKLKKEKKEKEKKEKEKKDKDTKKDTKDKDTKKKSSLRSSLVRIAFNNPHLRADLLPLVRTKVAKSPRKKWENPNNGRSKVVYVEAILDNPKQLLNWWEKNVKDYMGAGDPVPLLDTKVAHHMTIAYGGNNPGIPLAEVEQMGIGGKVQLEVIGYDYSDKVQAVLVKPKGTSSSNRYPHITVAVGNGGKPADSNDLLARRNIKDVPSKITLSATIGYFGRGKHHTQIDWESE